MRACTGCRKRKIKCDAATTNTWPCSACTRLKVVCVPPSIGQDGDLAGQGVEADPISSMGPTTTLDPSPQAFPMSQSFGQPGRPSIGSVSPYSDGSGMFHQFIPPPGQPSLYGSPPHPSYQPQMFAGPQAPSLATSESDFLLDNDQSTAENLSEVLGELKIDETGIGTGY